MNRKAALVVALTFSATIPGKAFAQSDTVLVPPALPDDFDRGRNISVAQRSRPDYDATGIRLGSFNMFPQLSVTGGYSDNIYNSGNDPIGDGVVEVAPSVQINSDWSRNALKFRAGTQVQRYFSNSLRNQTPWTTGLQGTLELGDSLRLIPEVQVGRIFEGPFSSDISGTTAALSNYLQVYGGMRGEYSSGQIKLTLSVDDTDYGFNNITLPNNFFVDQSGRDRNILRTTGQVQYAFTPSVSAYGQFTYSRIGYKNLLIGGIANRDSSGYQGIAGFNFDLSGLLRGTIGLGVTTRNFDSPLYRSVTGLSAQAKLEYFPSELTTFTLEAGRLLNDSNISTTSTYFDNRVGLRVDHELLGNLILNAYGQYSHQNYVDSNLSVDVYRVGGGGTYLASNVLSLNLISTYTGRTSGQQTLLGQNFNEFQIRAGFTIKR